MKRTGEFGDRPFDPLAGNALPEPQPFVIRLEKEETKIIPTAPLEFDLSNGEPPSHADIIAEIERNQREISELRAQQASATTETPSSS